jgi:hypothetical protein
MLRNITIIGKIFEEIFNNYRNNIYIKILLTGFKIITKTSIIVFENFIY